MSQGSVVCSGPAAANIRSCRTADDLRGFGAFVVSNDGSFGESHGVHSPPHSLALPASRVGKEGLVKFETG